MHRCDPDDHAPCNAWCEGTTHVDMAYCDAALVTRNGTQATVTSFGSWHAWKHDVEYQTPACTILAMTPAPEGPPPDKRYTGPVPWRDLSAFRVTYQVHTPNQENPLWPAGQ
jgi:hypothetical protein